MCKQGSPYPKIPCSNLDKEWGRRHGNIGYWFTHSLTYMHHRPYTTHHARHPQLPHNPHNNTVRQTPPFQFQRWTNWGPENFWIMMSTLIDISLQMNQWIMLLMYIWCLSYPKYKVWSVFLSFHAYDICARKIHFFTCINNNNKKKSHLYSAYYS